MATTTSAAAGTQISTPFNSSTVPESSFSIPAYRQSTGKQECEIAV
jgi:hypothetical protein